MKKLLSLFVCTFCLAQDSTTLYKEAQNQENLGNYKEAMLLYKKAANLTLSKEDNYINELENNNSLSQNVTTLRREFYQKEINKTQDESTNESIKQLVTKDFGIYAYKKNYLLPATYTLNNFEDRENLETTFQISVEKPIYYNLFNQNEVISAAYTQKSFWQITESSAPFRETNYEPEIFIQVPFYDKNSYLKAYKISAMHSSNGKDEEDSRSLNKIYLEGYFQFSELFIIPKVWYRIPEGKNDDNPDIEDYYGYGDLTFLYAYKKHTFELLVRNNLKFDDSNKGAVEFNWMFPLPEFLSTKNSYGMLQIFSGYGNSLIDYNKEINNVGLGIAFSR